MMMTKSVVMDPRKLSGCGPGLKWLPHEGGHGYITYIYIYICYKQTMEIIQNFQEFVGKYLGIEYSTSNHSYLYL